MRRHCLVTLGNRCTTAEAPVPPHTPRIFGMSDEQVLCIIHLCSIFHVQEQESGFGVYRGVGWGGWRASLPDCWLSVVLHLRRSLSEVLFQEYLFVFVSPYELYGFPSNDACLMVAY